MTPAQILTLTAGAALLLIGSRRRDLEAAEGDYLGAYSLEALADNAERWANILTEEPADVDAYTAQRNLSAFLAMIRMAEGTEGRGVDPYRVCYGYTFTARRFDDHPAVLGDWRGERLSDTMCANAGLGPGCVSTAAGAYQIIRPTWVRLKAALGLPDFSPDSQDRAATRLIADRGALQDVYAGRVLVAISKCRNEWASLPGNYAKQGQRSAATLLAWYQNNGGAVA